ncbi:hypothetical protein [Roseomonas sp. USHLN139]|uniref:hypothetical protein n=1 Tax=Roseomonas sp. USHLN139 TaxID=3081298 RepID=UPI003B025ACF
MRRHPWRLLLLSLFALTLLGQSVAAPAHCLRLARPAGAVAGFAAEVAQGWARLGIALPICTPDGLRGDAGDTPAPAEHGEPGFCAAAQSLPQAWLPDPPRLPLPRWQLAAGARPPAPPGLPAAAGRVAAFAARAPPMAV